MLAVFGDSLEFLEASKKNYAKAISLYEDMEFSKFVDKLYETCFTATQSLICLVKKEVYSSHTKVYEFIQAELVRRRYIGEFLMDLYMLMSANSGNLQVEQGDRLSGLGDVEEVKSNAEIFLEVVYKLIISLSGKQISF